MKPLVSSDINFACVQRCNLHGLCWEYNYSILITNINIYKSVMIKT